MGAQGTTTINFGAYPGTTDATAVVTGQAGILAGSLVEAWILPASTADHSVDEHWLDPPRIVAGNIVAGTGFTIYGVTDDRNSSLEGLSRSGRGPGGTLVANDPPDNTCYGVWNVAWCWN